MLPNFCKSCQYCLESWYWQCCEEKFCFDKKIATYKLEEDNTTSTHRTNGYVNVGASLDSVVTTQPVNNNHLPPTAIVERATTEIPLHADKLYELTRWHVKMRSQMKAQEPRKELALHKILKKQINAGYIVIFSKSLIFREEHELKPKGSTETLDDFETKSEPDLSEKPNRTKVYFEDEVNSPVTDFEIMFKDELLANHDMFKIEEEEESIKSEDTEDGLVMNVVPVKKQDVIKTSTVTMKDETKITTTHPIYKYDPVEIFKAPSSLSLPRNESVKGILRQKGDISRSNSAKTLERVDSSAKINKPLLNRVESLKNIDPLKINKVLARVPHRSASFLNIPQHLIPEKPPLIKSKSMVGVLSDSELKLSSLPDTPIIKSNNLPKFFADSPSVPEYKTENSLQLIRQTSQLMFQANDFSMPRYYGIKALEPIPVHESKSMPDLRNPVSTAKVSKRLVKLRSRLKPLVIKKNSSERL